ncbi:hypothetical protein AB0G04_26180 [Actinoplanes sp. NPDC023801]|uniref:hypothetical protein n=1 Tax=Actinoplanes sp. NPDC023801 TaxID=3154595 RepID=UPI003403F981
MTLPKGTPDVSKLDPTQMKVPDLSKFDPTNPSSPISINGALGGDDPNDGITTLPSGLQVGSDTGQALDPSKLDPSKLDPSDIGLPALDPSAVVPEKPEDMLPGKPEDLWPQDGRHIPVGPYLDDRLTSLGSGVQSVVSPPRRTHIDDTGYHDIGSRDGDWIKAYAVNRDNPRYNGRCERSRNAYVTVHYGDGKRTPRYMLRVSIKPGPVYDDYRGWNEFAGARTLWGPAVLYPPRNLSSGGYMGVASGSVGTLASGALGVEIIDPATRNVLHRQISGWFVISCGLDQDIYLNDIPNLRPADWPGPQY